VCICVLYYCHRLATQLQLTNIYHIISYHIISYHIISYHIISYHIISYISYRTISYIISYIISYHILSQINQVHALSTSFKIHSNIILLSTPRSSEWCPSLRFPHLNPKYNTSIHQTCHTISRLLWDHSLC